MTNNYALKVLLVDDEPKVIDTLIYALRNRPYHLRSASSGKEALAKFADEAADILVTDIRMPGMSGLELINKVLAKYPDVQVVVVSAYGEIDIVIEAMKIGALDFLQKPVAPGVIQMSIASAAEKWQLRHQLRLSNELLAKENQFLSVTLRSIGDGVITTDVDGNITLINRIAEQLTGWTHEEAIGRPLTEVFVVYNEKTKEICENPAYRVLETGLVAGLANHTVLRAKDGVERSIGDSAAPIRDHENKIVGIVLVFRDVTMVNKINNDLAKTQKLESVGILAGGIAHEFNNALMGIMGNIELLKIDFSEDGGIDKHLEPMKSAGHRMSHLTAQLLAYAEGGKYQPKDLKLNDFVIETLPILQHNLSPTVRVETVFPKDISHIEADHAQMQMVLSAILANSNEAIEDEGIIRITAENKDLDENFTKQHPGLEPGYYVSLTIEDDGRGMDEETKRGIFEPFFTTKFQGRGMGMAAVYGVVMNHDGGISVDSELGKGTTVRIYLPAIEIEVEKPKKRAKAGVSTGTGTILMIEDEDVVIEVTQAMLEMLGYRVMLAKTGKDAIHIAETFDGQIDLALLDIKLPDTNGRNLYPLIMKARPDLKVVVFSGYSIDGPAREILDAGAQDFIQKPFSIATLSEKLKVVLEGE